MRSRTKIRGAGLIEVLVGMTVGLLLLAGILEVVMNSTRAYRLQNSVVRMQENGQFAVQLLGNDLRNVGFWGCLPGLDSVTNHLAPGTFTGFDEALSGTEVANGPDTVTLRGVTAIGSSIQVQAPFGPLKTSPVTVSADNGITANQHVLIGDCLSADLFQVTSVSPTDTLNHAETLSRVYTDTAFVYLPYTHIYSVQLNANGEPALFRDLGSGPEEFIDGVENMIIEYGEDTDGDGVANLYRRANTVADMDAVVTLRISLVLQTPDDNLAPAPEAYTFNGSTITPTDRRMRRVYTSTVVLRNRVS